MSDVDTVLGAITTSLTARFDGVVDADTVSRQVADTYVALHRTAHADTRLPELAQRFAADRLTALAQHTGRLPKPVPEVLFVCVHNAGRSQMAAALMAHHANATVRAHSAGSQPDPTPSATAATVLAELGVSLDDAFPKPITDDLLRAVDVVVIAGGDDAVPRLPGPRYEVWDLPHLPGSDLDGVRQVRDAIDHRVQALLDNLTTTRQETPMSEKPSVLFVCVHNAGRSQMAAGWLRHLAGDAVEVRSAGSAPAETINPAAVEAMREVGIDITDQKPKILEYDTVQSSDVIVTMGCGDACPYFPGKRYEDWKLEDPAGKGVESVRPIRDEIKTRVEALLADLIPAS